MELFTKIVCVLLTVVATSSITDRSTKGDIGSICGHEIKRCGEFVPPKAEFGEYECRVKGKRTCKIRCTLKCPVGFQGRRMDLSRFVKRYYYCNKNRKWAASTKETAYCYAKWPVDSVSQNFAVSKHLNNLAHKLLTSSYFYLGMASFYQRADVALPGFSKFMSDLWQEDAKHGLDLLTYINTRGGYITFKDIPRPTSHEKLLMNLTSRAGQVGMEQALEANKQTKEKVNLVHRLTTVRFRDPHLKHILEDTLLSSKVKKIEQIGGFLTQLKSFPSQDYNLGEYSMDQELQKS